MAGGVLSWVMMNVIVLDMGDGVSMNDVLT